MKGFFPLDGGKYEVARVIDGDTLVIKTTGNDLRVRVIGIDTPETVHPGRPVEPGGPEATARAKALLERQTITIHYDPNPKHGKLDKYKRLLAYIELPDGRDFGLVMIREDFARVYLDYPFTRQASYLEADRNTNTHPPERSLDMKFGSDMWSWLRFIIGLIRLLKEIFGDDEDREDIAKNGDPLNEKPKPGTKSKLS